jgi:hypothetical protein
VSKKNINIHVGTQSYPISYLDPDKEFGYKLNIKLNRVSSYLCAEESDRRVSVRMG